MQKTVDGQPLTSSNGQPVEQLKWDFTAGDHFRFGRYYAKLVFVYSNGTVDIPATRIISFWVIPWELMLIVLVLLIPGMIGLYVMGRKIAGSTFSLGRKRKVVRRR